MKQWTIGKRITLGFLVLLALIILLGASGWYKSLKIGAGVDSLTKDSLPGVKLTSELINETLDYRIINMKHVMSTNAVEMADLDKKADEQAQNILKVLAAYQKTIVTAEERQLTEKVEPLLNGYRTVAKQIRKLNTENKQAEAIALLNGDGAKAYDLYELAVLAVRDYNLKVSDVTSATVMAALQSSKLVTAVILVLSLLLGIAFAIVIVRSIGKVLRDISNTLSASAEQTASAAGQVSAASQSLAEGASEQAASLEETSSSLEEMSSMTKRNAESAQKVNELGKQARVAADNGANDMQAMSKAMDEIKVSSDEIAKIIKTIDEIAFQTNILALNAAVEAARAGEAGMGFAVVADEVRSLAQRSARAAKETADKIEGAITKTAQGVTISGKVAQGLQEIVGKARQVDELAAEVASASREQSQGIDQVNTAVGQMDKVTQSNAASAEESASAAEELNAQADALKEAVSDLMKLVDGKGLDTQGSKPKARRQRTEVAGQPAQEVPHAKAPSSNGHGHQLVQPRDTGAAVMAANGKKSSEIPMEGDFKNF